MRKQPRYAAGHVLPGLSLSRIQIHHCRLLIPDKSGAGGTFPAMLSFRAGASIVRKRTIRYDSSLSSVFRSRPRRPARHLLPLSPFPWCRASYLVVKTIRIYATPNPIRDLPCGVCRLCAGGGRGAHGEPSYIDIWLAHLIFMRRELNSSGGGLQFATRHDVNGRRC